MIQANEIRIGNHILLDDKYRARVVALSENTITTENPYNKNAIGYTGDVWECATDFISPIPLTPELLEACGFISDPDQVFTNYYSLGKVTVDLDNHICNFIAGNIIVHIYSLHQLQNLYFALTGVELEVNLPALTPSK